MELRNAVFGKLIPGKQPYSCRIDPIARQLSGSNIPSRTLEVVSLHRHANSTNDSHDQLLRWIAAFKFLKGALLIALGVGAFKLLHKDVGELVEHWVDALRLDPENHYINAILAKSSMLTPKQITKLGLGSFLYAGLFFTEGTGLWLRKLWGEWLTVIITGTLVPLEIYEIYRHPTWVRVAVLVLNVAIVGYLIWRIRREEEASAE